MSELNLNQGAIYDPLTGEIKAMVSASSPAGLLLQATDIGDDMLYVGVANDERQYIDIEADPIVAVDKTVLSADFDKLEVTADGVDYVTLETLPIPCVVSVDGVPFLVEDGSFELVLNTIGEYKIEVNHPKYFRKEWTVNGN